MTTFTIGVVAHVQRRDMANQLATLVNATYISIDDGTLGFGNHRRVWSLVADEHKDWAVVLEDDAMPVINFTHQLDAALTHAPTPIVSLYLGSDDRTTPAITDAVAKAKANDAAYILGRQVRHAVALAIRTQHVPSMLTYVTRRRYLPIDDAINAWQAQHLNTTVAYTAPSLVDHRDTPTVITRHRDGKPRTTPRTAFHVGTRHDWTTGTVTI